MTSRERVLAAIEFRAPDRLPRHDGFWTEFAEAWRASKGLDAAADPARHYGIDVAICIGDETLFPGYAVVVEETEQAIVHRDGWGRTTRASRDGYFETTLEALLDEPRNLERLAFEPATDERRYADFERQVEQARLAAQAVFLKTGGPYIRSSFARGTERLLMDMGEDDGFSRELFRRLGEHLLAIGLEQLRRAGDYALGLWIYDDMCSLLGPMFSPHMFERQLLPVYQRMIDGLKSAGCPRVFLHCDGNVAPLLDMLVDAGISGLNPVEPRAGMDALALRRRYGDRLAIVGGVCNSVVLPDGDRAEIELQVRPLAEAGREGGIVIGSHSIGKDIAPETYDYYISLLERYGSYEAS